MSSSAAFSCSAQQNCDISSATQAIELYVPQFDSTLGTLTQIQIGLANLNFSDGLQIVGGSVGSGSISYTNAELSETVTLVAPSFTTVTANIVTGPATGQQTVGNGSFAIPIGPVSETTSGDGIIPSSEWFLLDQANDQTALGLAISSPVVSGSVVASSSAVASLDEYGPMTVTGDATITYTYTPALAAVPEPSSSVLLLAGLFPLSALVTLLGREGRRQNVRASFRSIC